MILRQLGKFVAAMAVTLIVLAIVAWISGPIFNSHAPETPGYPIEVAGADSEEAAEEKPADTEEEKPAAEEKKAEEEKPAAEEKKAEEEKPVEKAEEKPAAPAGDTLAALLGAADVDAGKKVSKKCAACHTFDKGGKKKVGPNLYGIVTRPVASVEGFKYSKAMKAFGTDKTWTLEQLNTYLIKPKAMVKGTTMSFGGLKKAKQRADLILFLRSLADEPVALPSE